MKWFLINIRYLFTLRKKAALKQGDLVEIIVIKGPCQGEKMSGRLWKSPKKGHHVYLESTKEISYTGVIRQSVYSSKALYMLNKKGEIFKISLKEVPKNTKRTATEEYDLFIKLTEQRQNKLTATD